MRLRTKLFITIGILFLAMSIIMFIFPNWFIDKDIDSTGSKMNEILRTEQQNLQLAQSLLLRREIGNLESNINSVLSLINDTTDVKQWIFSNEITTSSQLWKTASQIGNYNPFIGLIQLHNLSLVQEAAVIIPHNAVFYSTRFAPLTSSLFWVFLENDDGQFQKNEGSHSLYIALPLAMVCETCQNQNVKDLYLFIGWEELIAYPKLPKKFEGNLHEGLMQAYSELQNIFEDPEHVNPYESEFKDKWLNFPKHSNEDLLTQALPKNYSWGEKIRCIEFLTPFFVDGVSLFGQQDRLIPAGILIKKGKEGGAILAKDIYRTFPLFDDEKYFLKNHPRNSSPAIAQSSVVIEDPLSQNLFMGNTLKIDDNLITVGISFDILAKHLALTLDQVVIFTASPNIAKGFSQLGQLYHQIDPPLLEELRQQPSGKIIFQGKGYNYFMIPISKERHLDFYILTPQDKENALFNSLSTLSNKMKWKMSLQIFLVCFFSLIVALLVLARISKGITKPISQLAMAADAIGKGKYEEAIIPKIEDPKNEIGILARAFEKMINGMKDRERIRAVLDKVVSKDVAEEILKSTLHLGGEDRIVTMLFSDIRGFTEMSENLTSQQVIKMLNIFMTKMSRVIEGEGGVIDKYVGDEIMALYGAPTAHPDDALRAISSALLMIETLKRWNEERSKQGESIIQVGIGIHTGVVVAGNMGAEDRLNYTVIGSNVNLASRLCSAAAPMQIIISEDTLHAKSVQDSFYVTALSLITLKGFSDPIQTYEVTGFKWS